MASAADIKTREKSPKRQQQLVLFVLNCLRDAGSILRRLFSFILQQMFKAVSHCRFPTSNQSGPGDVVVYHEPFIDVPT